MNEWVAISGFISTAGVALSAFLYAAWVTKKLDALHDQFREAVVVATSAKGEVATLHDALKETNDQLLDERKRHQDESQLLSGDLEKARAAFAKAATPDGIRDGLTRRPLPSSLPTGQQKALTPPPTMKPLASDNDATTRMPPPKVKP